jgi:SPRY domain
MATHRYWRAVALEAYGAGDIEMSCFHLLDSTGSRVDSAATLTASAAPGVGVVASLQDDDLTTSARWPVKSVAGLSLMWDFGASPVDVSDIRLAGGNNARFPLIVKMQYSDDASAWTDAVTFTGITWPGVGVKTASLSNANWWSRTHHGLGASVGSDQLSVSSLGNTNALGVVAKSSGKLQFEIVPSGPVDPNSTYIGVATASVNLEITNAAGICSYSSQGYAYIDRNPSVFGASYTAGDCIGVVVDFSVGSLTFYKNGVYQGVATATGLLGQTLYPSFGANAGGSPTPLSAVLRGTGFAYPVAAASAWSDPSQVQRNLVPGRSVLIDASNVGTDPVMTYGTLRLDDPVYLSIESGSVKDQITGVLGRGTGRVRGSVKNTPGTPVYRKVRLHRERDGLLIRELWSDRVTGAYDFRHVDELQTYTILSYDHTGTYNGVIAANITPELMA